MCFVWVGIIIYTILGSLRGDLHIVSCGQIVDLCFKEVGGGFV